MTEKMRFEFRYKQTKYEQTKYTQRVTPMATKFKVSTSPCQVGISIVVPSYQCSTANSSIGKDGPLACQEVNVKENRHHLAVAQETILIV